MASGGQVRRVFVNTERALGREDYGAEFCMWWVVDGRRLVPVRRLENARILDREDFDRLPPGVMSRIAVEVELPVGTEVVLLVRRPKATRLPRNERRRFYLTADGGLARKRRDGTRRPRPRESAKPSTLQPEQQAEMARRVLGLLG